MVSKSIYYKAEQDLPPLHGRMILIARGNVGLEDQCILANTTKSFFIIEFYVSW